VAEQVGMVAEIARRGKLVYAEPYFTPGLPLLLEQRARGETSTGDLVLVRAGRGRAKLEAVLGRASDIEVVLEGLLVERGLRRPFEPYELPSPPLESRVDLRDELTFTVDPETAKDFDDAVSIRSEPRGTRVFVHIADVSAYLPGGVPLDHGAAGRGFSTYVPGRVAPMLPPLLSEGACSLRPYQDRLCVTVEALLAEDLEALEIHFYRSLIRSRARLSYPQVERILAGKERVEPELGQALELARTLTTRLRRRRFARGALQIESPEVVFAFDGRGGVERAWLEREPEAHALIEELMILANEAVGAFLAGRAQPTLYRVHERPDAQALTALLTRLAALEVPTPPAPEQERLSPSDAEQLAAAIAAQVADYVRRSGRGREAFPALVLRSLKQARYDARNLGHSGLASTAYCHFTSPIRRYPDVVCHRALLRELGLADEGEPVGLDALAEHVSEAERSAAQVEYLADEICLAWLLQDALDRQGHETSFEGEVTGVIDSGLFVRFGEVFEGYLPVRRLGGDYFELDALATALVGRAGGRRFRLGDGIEVVVERIDRPQGKVELRPAATGRAALARSGSGRAARSEPRTSRRPAPGRRSRRR
jgi:ribonuclease R